MSSISLALDSPELAHTYDSTSDPQYNHGKELISALRVRPGQRVLDVGAGTGRLSAYVADVVGPQGDVVAIDPLPLRVDLARAKGRTNLTAAIGRAEDLSTFPDSGFDVVYYNSVLHWVEDKARALGEAARVLKPGGRVGFSTAARERPHDSEALLRGILSDVGAAEGQTIPHKVTVAESRALVQAAGLREVSIEIRTFVDTLRDVDDFITWSASSSFGNFLSRLTPDERARVRDALAHALEARRTPEGLRLERHLIFAVAEKPGVS